MMTTSFLSVWDQLAIEDARGVNMRNLKLFSGLTVISVVLLVLCRVALAWAGTRATTTLHERRLAALLTAPPAPPETASGAVGPLKDPPELLKLFQVRR